MNHRRWLGRGHTLNGDRNDLAGMIHSEFTCWVYDRLVWIGNFGEWWKVMRVECSDDNLYFAKGTPRPLNAGYRTWYLFVVCTLFVSACASIPQAQLEAYANAFDDAKRAALKIYAQLPPALENAGEKPLTDEEFPASLGSSVFVRDGCPTVLVRFTSLHTRCLAIQAAADYNDALVQLNRGAHAPQVSTQLQALSSKLTVLSGLATAGAGIPIVTTVSAIAAPLGTIVDQALRYNDAVAAKQKLTEGAPEVIQLIEALRKDIEHIHKVKYEYANVLLTGYQNQIDAQVNQALKLSFTHLPPSNPETINARKALDERFNRMFSAAEPTMSKRLPDVVGVTGSPLSDTQIRNMNDYLTSAEPAVSGFHDIVAEWSSFSEAIQAYDKMLSELSLTFSELVSLSNSPMASGGAVDRLVEASNVIRKNAIEIEDALAAQ